jgi:hypothetical protein
MALANLADKHADNQERIGVAGGIESVVGLLGDEVASVRARAIIALVTLAANHANQEHLAEMGGITSLVGLLGDEVASVREIAVAALANLADKHTVNQERIGVAGGITSLVGLLGDEVASVRQHAVMALANLAANHVVNQQRIGVAGGVTPLVGLLGDEVASVRARAIMALANLADKRAVKKELIGVAGGIEALVRLLRETDLAMLRYVAGSPESLAYDYIDNQELVAAAKMAVAIEAWVVPALGAGSVVLACDALEVSLVMHLFPMQSRYELFMQALLRDHLDFIVSLLREVDYGYCSDKHDGDTVVHALARYSQAGVLGSLPEGTNTAINLKNNQEETPLMISSRMGDVRVARILLAIKASVQTETSAGLSCLHIAAEMGHVSMVELLLQHKADPRVSCERDGERYTPLLFARSNRNQSVVELLEDVMAISATS